MIGQFPLKLPTFVFITAYLYLQSDACSSHSAFQSLFYLYLSRAYFLLSSQHHNDLWDSTLPEKSLQLAAPQLLCHPDNLCSCPSGFVCSQIFFWSHQEEIDLSGPSMLNYSHFGKLIVTKGVCFQLIFKTHSFLDCTSLNLNFLYTLATS